MIVTGYPLCPLRTRALATPDAEAFVGDGERLTWSQLDGRVTALAKALGEEGVSGGDGIALLSDNSLSLALHVLALARIGARGILLNARLTPLELRSLVERVHPRRLFASAAFSQSVPGSEPLRPATQTLLETGPTSLHPSSGAVLFTSGTTGIPRPALLTHFAFEHAATASRARLGTNAASRWLCNLPLFHVGGLAMLWRCVHDGSTFVLHPRFDEAATAKALDSERITHLSLVGTSLLRLMEHGVPSNHRLHTVLVGGGPAPRHVVDSARAAGLPIRLTYGLTEACAQVCTQSGNDGYDVGTALDGYAVRIVNEAGEALPPGEEGELEVSSTSLMSCYLYDEKSSRAARRGIWLKTGDFGSLDEQGRLRVLGRRVDLLVRGGENVYPAEIEAALLQHPQVRDAGVTAIDDARWGQVPLALVVSRDGFDEGALRDWCKGRLASFKVPTTFRRVDELPRNAMGKLDRRALTALGGQP